MQREAAEVHVVHYLEHATIQPVEPAKISLVIFASAGHDVVPSRSARGLSVETKERYAVVADHLLPVACLDDLDLDHRSRAENGRRRSLNSVDSFLGVRPALLQRRLAPRFIF